jgi:hypothetical protein
LKNYYSQEFRNKLIPPNSAVRMNMVRSNSYNSVNSNNSNSGGGVTPPVAGTPNQQLKILTCPLKPFDTGISFFGCALGSEFDLDGVEGDDITF